MDLAQVRDALADVEGGGEGRVPRQIAEDVALDRGGPGLDGARPREVGLEVADLRLDVLQALGDFFGVRNIIPRVVENLIRSLGRGGQSLC